jgi:4-carboxymuconolactone decarboxylase
MEAYYHPHDLGKFVEMGKGHKGLWEKFMACCSAVLLKGLTEREKALMALAVAHAVQSVLH